jgi:5'(3')-deoxyribonucleotidase
MTQGAKPVLAVDVDDVLYPLVSAFIDYHNRLHGTKTVIEDFVSYHMDESMGITRDEFLERFRAFGDEGGFTKSRPAQQSQQAIKKLSETYDMVIVTSRWQQWEQDTIDWLQEHFPDIFHDVHFANSIAWHRGDKFDKATICQELGAVAFIDDSLHNVEQVAATGIRSLLFGDYAWNQTDELPDNAQRVKDWDEVLEVLL